MIRNEDHWQTVTSSFSDAAITGDWTAALTTFADACGADRGQLIGIGSDKAIPFNWIAGSGAEMPPQGMQEFVEMGGGDPRNNPRVHAGLRAPPLKAWHDLDCLSEATRARFPRYCDLAVRYDFPYGSQANLIVDDEMLIGTSTLRGARLGPPSDEDRRAFELVLPHLRSAVRLQMTLEGQGASLMAGALEAVGAAAFVLDSRGHVRALTQAAEAALADGPVRLRGRRLGAVRDDEARLLERAVDAALAGFGGPGDRPARTVALRPIEDPLAPVLADVAPLPSRSYSLGFQPRVLVTLRGMKPRDAGLALHLKSVFGLSPAEAEIALRLADGDDRAAIAADRGASLETVRSQIRSLFAKMGVSRTAELTARLNRFR